jgi:glycosyltransferase involved in cell wall biosynthesis
VTIADLGSEAPVVSVCMPSYNHAQFLGLAIESVLVQTLDSIEIIVVDDGSTDDSLAIARAYSTRYPRKIRVLTHPDHAHRGPGAAMNLATAHCRGEYRTTLASDDLYLRGRLETHHRYLERHASVQWLYGPVAAVDGVAQPIDLRLGYDITSADDPIGAFIERNPCNGIAVLARMEAIRRMDGHAEHVLYSDWDFWFRFFLSTRPAYVDDVLVLKRVHGANASVAPPERSHRQAAELFEHLRDTVGRDLAPHHRALIRLQLCHRRFMIGASDEARAHLAAAFQEDPELRQQAEWIADWAVRCYTRETPGIQPDTADRFVEWLPREIGELAEPPLGSRIHALSQGALVEFRASRAYVQGDHRLCQSLIRDGLRRGRRSSALLTLYVKSSIKSLLG